MKGISSTPALPANRCCAGVHAGVKPGVLGMSSAARGMPCGAGCNSVGSCMAFTCRTMQHSLHDRHLGHALCYTVDLLEFYSMGQQDAAARV